MSVPIQDVTMLDDYQASHTERGGFLVMRPDEPPIHTLSVSEIETLAKAGVSMTFNDIKHQVRPNRYQDQPERVLIDDRLARALYERIKTNLHLTSNPMMFNEPFPYQLAAAGFEETIYVFAVSDRHPPVILTDPRHCYPSDALMAKLALLKDQANGT